jgi:hypothetical protein
MSRAKKLGRRGHRGDIHGGQRWHTVQVHKGVRSSGAKHDAREWAVTRQMTGVQAEDGR